MKMTLIRSASPAYSEVTIVTIEGGEDKYLVNSLLKMGFVEQPGNDIRDIPEPEPEPVAEEAPKRGRPKKEATE